MESLPGAVYEQELNKYLMTAIEKNARGTTESVYPGAFTSAP
jgi:hypothetical protein